MTLATVVCKLFRRDDLLLLSSQEASLASFAKDAVAALMSPLELSCVSAQGAAYDVAAATRAVLASTALLIARVELILTTRRVFYRPLGPADAFKTSTLENSLKKVAKGAELAALKDGLRVCSAAELAFLKVTVAGAGRKVEVRW